MRAEPAAADFHELIHAGELLAQIAASLGRQAVWATVC
jgi:hypothetical protein